jgi:hypothetical protein
MSKTFTKTTVPIFSVAIRQNMKGMFVAMLLIFISGLFFQVYAQPAHDSVGLSEDVFGYVLNDFHTIYVGLTADDTDDNQQIDAMFTLSQDTIKEYGEFALGVRFAGGIIDARNGDKYAADATINYNFNQLYHCWIQTVVSEKIYSVYIQTEGMDQPVQIASDYAYRASNVTSLDVWSSAHNSQGDKSPLILSNLSIVGAVGDIPIVDSTDATLSALSVSSGKLSPVFSSETTEYDVVATYGSTSVDVTATPTVANATVTGAGTIDVSSGSGTANVIVTALNGTDKKTYTINITVSDTPPSDDATLSALSVSTGTLDPTFDPSVASYTVLVPTGTSSVTVNATTNDDNASVTGDGAVNLSSGSGKATVVVTAEDGTTKKTYTVNITVGNAVTKITESQLKVFPNPAQHAFKISMEGLFSYEIYDITGALVINGIANDELYIGGELNSGAYLLKVTQEGRSGTFKLFKY